MEKPVLVVMAAGMGSRYGGLKQMEPISEQGEIIVDFSLYDAYYAGFEQAVFIIKEEMEADIRALLDNGAGKRIGIDYVFQKLDDLPTGYDVPDDRVKPWGTGHAVMSARNIVKGPMAVINADDYYGPQAFERIFSYLSSTVNDDRARYAMAGYILKNTITEYGHVARGVCSTDKNGFLTNIEERTKIMRRNADIAYTEDDKIWTVLPEDSVVSMNFWGFTNGFMEVLTDGFPIFLDKALIENPLGSEYFLPAKVNEMIESGMASVEVLKTEDRWLGITYREDREAVVNALQALKDRGDYPEKLWL